MFLEKQDVSLYYEVRGEGETLILVHGMIVDAGLYENAARLLSRYYKVVTFDRRGNSRSRLKDDPAPQFSIDAQAEDIRDLMDAVGAEQAYIAGASAGAVIGQYFLCKYPERVKYLIMYEPAMLGLLASEDQGAAEWIAEIKDLIARNKINTTLLKFSQSIGEPDDRSPAKTQEAAVRELDNVEFCFKNEFSRLIDYIPDLEELKKHRDIISVATGEKSAGTRYEKQAKVMAQLLDKEPVYYPGGHNLPYDLPKEFAICVLGTLKFEQENWF